jgi:RHS repeat-associated protein
VSRVARALEQGIENDLRPALQDAGKAVENAVRSVAHGAEGVASRTEATESEVLGKITAVGGKETDAAVTSAERGAAGAGRGASDSAAADPLRDGDPAGESVPADGRTTTKDPVDLVTGEVFLRQGDVALPGLLSLLLERVHLSNYRKGRWFGRSWASTFDQRVEIDEDGIHYAAPDGVVLHYPVPTQPGQRVLPALGARWPLAWDRQTDTVLVEQPELARTLHFSPGPTPQTCRPLAAVSDRNNNRVTFVHDREGVPTDVYHSGGYHLAVDSVTTRAGTRIGALRLLDGAHGSPGTVVVSFGYDGHCRLAETVNSSGLPLVFEYDDAERITEWVDRNGHRYTYHYDQTGRVVRTEGTDGYLNAAMAYDLVSRTTTLTDSLGHQSVYHWNELGQVVKVVDPLGGETLTELDLYGRLLSRTDPLGRTTRFVRDEHGDTVRVERPDGTAVEAEYGSLRLPTRVTGPDGALWRYAYDERGNLVSSTDPLGAVTAFEHDERGALGVATDALGHATRYEANLAGLPVTVIDPRGGVTRIGRDAFGNVSSLTDPTGLVTRIGWTAERNPAWREAPDGAREQWVYDPDGNLLEHRDANGGITAFEYGPFDKQTARTDPSGARYTFAYDTELRLVAVTNPAGLVWRYTYDGLDNLLAETDFNGRTLTYRYDAAGQLTERVNGAGEAVSFLRDELGRIAERCLGAAVERFSYDRAGRVLRAEGPGCVLEYTYDALSRMQVESVDGRSLVSEHDAIGQRIRRTTPTGAVSEWTFDAGGSTTALATAGGALTFQYDNAGRETTRYLGHGAALAQSYDAAGRLATQGIWAYDQSDDGSAVGRLAQQRSYTYRPDGYPVEVTDLLRGTRSYELDPLGRVAAVSALNWRETYAYDASGNLSRAATVADRDDPGADREFPGTLIRRAGRTIYEHDAQGRVTRRSRRTLSGQNRQWAYTWDAADRLVEVTTPDGAVWRYSYDPLGRRIAKRRVAEDGAVLEETRFTWDGSRLAEQVGVDAGGRATAISWDWEPGTFRAAAQTRRSWATDAPQAEIDTAFHAIVTDLVGTPTELVAADGRVAWHQSTDLWGNPVAAPDEEADCPLRFPGQYRDPETGLNYNFFRYYDPEFASYLSPDLLGLAPAPNQHAYVRNPLAWTDPLGLAPNETFYRGMSKGEYENQLKAKGGLWPLHGETFVTQDEAYIRQLAARHPGDYEMLVKFEMQPGTREALLAAGARDNPASQAVRDMGLDGLPVLGKGQADMVHIKAEKGYLNFGLRRKSVDIFNGRILDFGKTDW